MSITIGRHVLTVFVPVRTVSEANAHEHWRYRQQRAKAQRHTVGQHLMVSRRLLPALPVTVTLTRQAPRTLDEGDNLNTSMKHVRDEVAKFYGVDDRDSRIKFKYAQEKARTYAVVIKIAKGAQ